MRLDTYIRTRGRPDKQKTVKEFFLRELAQEGVIRLHIVIPKNEKREFIRHNPNLTEYIETTRNDYRSGDVFQYILDTAPRFVFCLDDDLTLGRRRNRLETSQRGSKATLEDVQKLIQRVKGRLNSRSRKFIHGGLSLRQNNHYIRDNWFKCNTRIACGASFWDASVIRGLGIRFDLLQARSCCHVWLTLLEGGYPNVCDYEFFVGQVTNNTGGCSDYRTPEFMREQAAQLVRLHPEVVKHFYKQRKSKAFDAIRDEQGVPDVRVFWKKAWDLQRRK